nr:immunoglobulin heavy chain junction region [Mus musculus]
CTRRGGTDYFAMDYW